jgi:phage terminase large subunit GpA-like protein
VRFSDQLPDEFFLGLTAEVFDPHLARWIKIRPRNEALDCVIYSMCAAMHPRVRVHTLRTADWERLQALYEPGEPKPPEPVPAEVVAAQAMNKFVARPTLRRNWVRNWGPR